MNAVINNKVRRCYQCSCCLRLTHNGTDWYEKCSQFLFKTFLASYDLIGHFKLKDLEYFTKLKCLIIKLICNPLIIETLGLDHIPQNKTIYYGIYYGWIHGWTQFICVNNLKDIQATSLCHFYWYILSEVKQYMLCLIYDYLKSFYL